MSVLKGKKVLLFIPNGKGIYGAGVSAELEKRGAQVTVYDERPSTSTLSKVLIRLAKSSIEKILSKYYDGILEKHKNDAFEFVLVVRGEAFTKKIIEDYRNAFKNAKFYLYLWDSLVYTNTVSLFSSFDKVLSYDLADVRKHPELIHRPLFYLDDYKNIAARPSGAIDVLFIGKVHHDRFAFIKNLETFFNRNGLKTYFYLYFPSRLLFIQKKLTDASFRKSKMSDFHFDHLPIKDVSYYMSQAKVSLDVQSPLQIGLTMRTLEVLGSKRKLITTNEAIKKYDFYNPENILVVDRNDPKIDPEFIRSPYKEIDPAIYANYSVAGWADEIFELDKDHASNYLKEKSK